MLDDDPAEEVDDNADAGPEGAGCHRFLEVEAFNFAEVEQAEDREEDYVVEGVPRFGHLVALA